MFGWFSDHNFPGLAGVPPGTTNGFASQSLDRDNNIENYIVNNIGWSYDQKKSGQQAGPRIAQGETA
jgi:hypothetical protein